MCAGLSGDVVELGFGSGPNLGAMPAEVTRILAVEPSDVAWRLSERRRSAGSRPALTAVAASVTAMSGQRG
ncbi:MAG: Methyltransferase type 11 [Humibacillus sp.]|nr:Methyltransferase type 11 [Humibacillus sp.]